MNDGKRVGDKRSKSGKAKNAWRQGEDRDSQIVQYPMRRIRNDFQVFLLPLRNCFPGRLCAEWLVAPATSIHRPLVPNYTFERVKFSLPRLFLQHMVGVLEAGLPTMSYSGPAEIDILGMVFVAKPRREQLNDMHPGRAAVRSEFLHCVAIAIVD